MKKSNSNLITLCILSFIVCTLIVVSCKKEQADLTLPVELNAIDENFKDIPINDPDIQEFIRIRNSFISQNSLTNEDISRLIDQLKSNMENLHEKYPQLNFDDLSIAEFFQKMNEVYPPKNFSRDSVEFCKFLCDIAILTEKVTILNNPAYTLELKLQLLEAVDAYKPICYADCEEDHGPGSGSGTGSGDGTCYLCANGSVTAILNDVDESTCTYNGHEWTEDQVSIYDPCPGSGNGSGSGSGGN